MTLIHRLYHISRFLRWFTWFIQKVGFVVGRVAWRREQVVVPKRHRILFWSPPRVTPPPPPPPHPKPVLSSLSPVPVIRINKHSHTYLRFMYGTSKPRSSALDPLRTGFLSLFIHMIILLQRINSVMVTKTTLFVASNLLVN
jgi:hypothetical protein